MYKKVVQYRGLLFLCLMGLLIAFYFSLPDPLFSNSYSTVLESSNGELLSARIAKDGQWRFPQSDSVPDKLAEAMITFEDQRFRSHPGVDVLSLARALRQNLKAGKVVSGGSTISMQVIRLSRRGKSRTWFEKSIELILATRLELRYSKDEILSLYASHAPFGGNVVGFEAACWRYFGMDPHHLSWAEASLLAVLPNAPSMIHPGKNRDTLKAKRDRLLDKLQKAGKIDSFTCELAKAEQIPEEPVPLPMFGQHLLNRMSKEGWRERKMTSTLDYHLQQRVEQIVNDHHQRLKGNQIFNAAAIVMEVSGGHVLAYVGNTDSGKEHKDAVDIISSARSTGSILKPFLYAAMLDEGKILPRTLLPDIPTVINGFAPKNFSRQYDGAVHADQALIRSLNIPAVYLLKDYRYEKFYRVLKEIGITTLSRPPDHYGLSLILGGAEGTLWDITGVYASMARTLNNYFERPGKNKYDKNDFHSPVYFKKNEPERRISLNETSFLSSSSIFLTFQALQELYRPGEESGWRYFRSSKQIAWKTGTSFGFRDGWAVGVTPDYVVGVWVGNADGEGRPGLTGTDAAAPLMFDIFSQLPSRGWFQSPRMEMKQIAICKKSGYRVSGMCDEVDSTWIPNKGLETIACPYHKTVHLTSDLKFQLHGECASLNVMRHVSRFVLPPLLEYYYKPKNLSYHVLPPFKAECRPSFSAVAMEMVYPGVNARIFIPRHIDGKPGSSIFELAHRNPNTEVFWHLDGQYVGRTKKIHHLAVNPPEGKHILTIVDEAGEALERHFEVISKM